MMTCERARNLLALHAGGDLNANNASRVEAHLGSCATCHLELSELSSLIRAAASLPTFEALPAAARARIAHASASRAVRSPWQTLTGLIRAVPPIRLVGAMVVAAILAVVALPVAFMDSVQHQQEHQVTSIDVVQNGGVVRLAWSNGQKESYTVYKSNDPQRFSSAEAHVVQGNVWTDETKDLAAIVFYRID